MIHQGKCGGSSIKKAMHSLGKQYNFDVVHWRGHLKIKEAGDIIEDYGDAPDDYFKFTIVRNPWDRTVSWYYHFLMHHQLTVPETPFEPWLIEHGIKLSFLDESQFDYCMRMEDIDSDFEQLLKKLNIPHHNLDSHIHYNTGRPNTDYRGYYNEKTSEMVRQKNKDIINQFNYKFHEDIN